MIEILTDSMNKIHVGDTIGYRGESLTVEGFYRQRGDHRYAYCRKVNRKTKYVAVEKLARAARGLPVESPDTKEPIAKLNGKPVLA